jgi:hypothetical protein
MSGGLWTGSPFAHPHAENLGVVTGLLSQQSSELRNGIGALRMGIRRGQVGHAPIPEEIALVLQDDECVRGTCLSEGTSTNRHTGDVRLLLCRRENRCFHWAIVEITHDTITVTKHRNPPE